MDSRISLVDLRSDELRLLEVKGLSGATDRVLLTHNDRRVAEDRRDSYWLYVVIGGLRKSRLHEIRDPARLPWREVIRVGTTWLEVDALRQPMRVREPKTPHGGSGG